MVSNNGLRILCYFYIRFDKVRKKRRYIITQPLDYYMRHYMVYIVSSFEFTKIRILPFVKSLSSETYLNKLHNCLYNNS